jgi:hypothetical protein
MDEGLLLHVHVPVLFDPSSGPMTIKSGFLWGSLYCIALVSPRGANHLCRETLCDVKEGVMMS